MKFFFLTFFFLFFVYSAVFAQTPQATVTPKTVDKTDDVVKISTTLIQIDVTVTDKNGKIVTDLKPEDFEVYENNQKQQITNFSFVPVLSSTKDSSEPSPTQKNTTKDSSLIPPAPIRPEQVRRTFALVVDDLSLSTESVYYVRRALKKFVDEQMQDGDLVAILSTGFGNGMLQQFTSDKRILHAAIEKLRWNPLGGGGLTPIAPSEGKSTGDSIQIPGQMSTADPNKGAKVGLRDADQEAANYRQSVFATGTVGSLSYIISGMKDLPGRKSILLFSEGFKLSDKDILGKEPNLRLKAMLEKVIDAANRASVVIYTTDVRGVEPLGLTAADNTQGYSRGANPQGFSPRNEIQQMVDDRRDSFLDTQEGLIFLARQTGGLPVLNNNDLNLGIEKMLSDQKGYYLIGYTPDSDTFDSKTRPFNKLTVKVKRSDLKVRYRSGFFGVTDEEVKATKQSAYQQTVDALKSPFVSKAIDLSLNTLFGSDLKIGPFVRSFLHINAKDLKFTDEPDGTHKTAFAVLAVSYGDNGTVADQISKNYTVALTNEVYQKILRDGLVYNFTFPVKKPGVYQLRVALRDIASEKIGSANQFIEIPNLKNGQLKLSGIILENLSVQQYQNLQANKNTFEISGESKADPQTDTSLRRFKRQTVLHYGFEIYNAKLDSSQKPQLTMKTRIFHDGKVFYEGKETAIETTEIKGLQKISSAGALSLGGAMQPGDYVLQIIVTDNLAKEKRRIAAQFVQFEITE
jgi:VWFA-related protein